MNLAELNKQNDTGEKLNPFYISFSDLMVLLCVFFVMILGMSKIEIGTFEKLKAGFTGDDSGTLVELARKLKTIASDQKGVTIELADDGVRLDFESAALFDTGKSFLKKGSLSPLEPMLKEILRTPYHLDIEGHSDDRAFFRREGDEVLTNWSLSGRRASSVVNYLIDFGFTQKRLRIIGYAATMPKAKIKGKIGDSLENARALNRRVSILVR